MTRDLSASILDRLLTLAKQRGDDYSLLLNRYGMERLLARISMSPHADRFLLKGALLFTLWYDTPHRPTLSQGQCHSRRQYLRRHPHHADGTHRLRALRPAD